MRALWVFFWGGGGGALHCKQLDTIFQEQRFLQRSLQGPVYQTPPIENPGRSSSFPRPLRLFGNRKGCRKNSLQTPKNGQLRVATNSPLSAALQPQASFCPRPLLRTQSADAVQQAMGVSFWNRGCLLGDPPPNRHCTSEEGFRRSSNGAAFAASGSSCFAWIRQ